MLKTTKPLHDLGFAIIRLRSKSKMPVDAGWTSGPRQDWDALTKAFIKGQNVGVRLGRASKLRTGGYLAVIDCDVKSKEPRHAEELDKRLGDLFGDELLAAPVVASGRGNGSKHVYIRTDEPVSPRRLAQSAETVAVYMPSAKPSPKEIKTLSPEDLAKGIRLRAAWEISLMGEGQQVVLPPSIHPDSGRPYIWVVPINAGKPLPRAELPPTKAELRGEGDGAPRGDETPFRPVTVDVMEYDIPDATLDLIATGAGCDDKSAGAFTVAMSLKRAGMSDNEILTILTDRETWIGDVGFNHAKTENRARAARWVKKYTLDKASKAVDPAADFEDMPEDLPDLSPEEAAEQAKTVATPRGWIDRLERGPASAGNRVKNTLRNVITILQGTGGDDVFVHNEFSGSDHYGRSTPWGGRKGEELKDVDLIRVRSWLGEHWHIEPSKDTVNDAMVDIAHLNRFHPVRDYLDSLTWDGVERIDTWLVDYLNASASPKYLSALSRKVLVAMVKRIYQPGCKFDHVLVLEGKQGVGKSTALLRLASDEWFTDAHIDVNDKDAVLTMRSKWLIELGELSGMRSADVDRLKEFVSQRVDRLRVPYGRRTENFPRQAIFIATTNRDEYLRDTTGNRRFWPVQVGKCDFDAIERDRDQLFAEAVAAYQNNETLYLEGDDVIAEATGEQAERTFVDSWVDTMRDFIEAEEKKPEDERKFNVDEFRISDLFGPFGPFPSARDDLANQHRGGQILRVLGFVKVRKRIKEGRIVFWSRPKGSKRG